MRFGVNYTPSVGWFHSWLDLSESDVARDMEQIAELSVDHVRIFPLWPLLQPNRTLIRPRGLADVVRVGEIAASFGLDVNVDALQGHLSSFDFVPSWLESWHRRNLFTDPDVVASTAEYVRTLSATVAGLPNLLGVTVGNEVNQFAHAPHPSPHPLTPSQASEWAERMTDAARRGLAGADALVTLAQYDAAWYDDDQPFGPEQAARFGDETVTHSWVFNGAAELDGALGTPSLRHGEYLVNLAAAWNPSATRRNWLQEVGAPTNVIPPTDAPDFVEQTMRNAAHAPHLAAITWWCSHDVPRSLADFPELEYDLGLITADGRRKPTGDRFAEVAAELRDAAPTPPSSVGLVLDDVDGLGSPAPAVRRTAAPGGAFAAAWFDAARGAGPGPQVVLRSRASDAQHLADRGIAELRHPSQAPALAAAHRPAHPATVR